MSLAIAGTWTVSSSAVQYNDDDMTSHEEFFLMLGFSPSEGLLIMMTVCDKERDNLMQHTYRN